MLSSILLTCISLAATATADCTRDALKAATAQLVAAQTAGKPSLLTAVADNVNYTESEKPVDFKAGILATSLKLDSVRNTHDTAGCATFTEIIAASNEKPYVIGTRMLFNGDGTRITAIENLVTKPGDWAFNATGYKYYNSLEKWDPIPEDKRDTRAVIKAAGDAYFERFRNASFEVPWGTPCARLEGGASTGARNPTGNTCSLGLPSTITVTNRSVVTFLGLPSPPPETLFILGPT